MLRCLASFAPDCIDDFVGAEGPNLVIEAMSRHAEPASLQDSCVSLLWSVSLRLHYANGFASMGSFQLAIHRLSAPRYLREVALQHQLCGLLWSLSLRPDHARMLCSPAWISVLAAAMRHHPSQPKLQEYGCAVLANLLALGGASAQGVSAQLLPAALKRCGSSDSSPARCAPSMRGRVRPPPSSPRARRCCRAPPPAAASSPSSSRAARRPLLLSLLEAPPPSTPSSRSRIARRAAAAAAAAATR